MAIAHFLVLQISIGVKDLPGFRYHQPVAALLPGAKGRSTGNHPFCASSVPKPPGETHTG
jgi:hypothetical protein